MNYAGLPGRPYSGRCVAFLIGLLVSAFFALSSVWFWSTCAHADVRRYDWPSVPTMSYPKEEIIRKVDYLCEVSKSDLGRYSDAAIDRFIGRFRDADSEILNFYTLFGLKEMNMVRGRLIKCEAVFKEEQHKRRLRAESGLEEDGKTDNVR